MNLVGQSAAGSPGPAIPGAEVRPALPRLRERPRCEEPRHERPGALPQSLRRVRAEIHWRATVRMVAHPSRMSPQDAGFVEELSCGSCSAYGCHPLTVRRRQQTITKEAAACRLRLCEIDGVDGHTVLPDLTVHAWQQYAATTADLDARIALHQHYSTAAMPWPRWVFDRLALSDGDRVLEVGAGEEVDVTHPRRPSCRRPERGERWSGPRSGPAATDVSPRRGR